MNPQQDTVQQRWAFQGPHPCPGAYGIQYKAHPHTWAQRMPNHSLVLHSMCQRGSGEKAKGKTAGRMGSWVGIHKRVPVAMVRAWILKNKRDLSQ